MSRRELSEQGFSLVEMLIVLVLIGVVGAATTSVLISTLRTEQFQDEMQTVMDESRIALRYIRGEVRAARQIFYTSCESEASCGPSATLHFWVDQDQDAIQSPDEVVCYLSEPIGETGTQFQLVRWTRDQTATGEDPDTSEMETGCDAAARPSEARVVARTLIPQSGDDEARPFQFDPPPPDPAADQLSEPTRNVRVLLRLEVESGSDHEPFEVESIIRLRNVA